MSIPPPAVQKTAGRWPTAGNSEDGGGESGNQPKPKHKTLDTIFTMAAGMAIGFFPAIFGR